MAKEKYTQKTHKLVIKPTDESNIWEAPWEIYLREDDPRKIGWISFAGDKANGTIPITIELEKYYKNMGYGTEALKVMTEFAFNFSDIYEIQTDSSTENDAYIHALEKAGFIYRYGNKESEHYSKVKEKTAWTGLYIVIGIIAGYLIGFVLSNLWVGLIGGVLVGIVLGSALDNTARQAREKVRGHKEISGRKNRGAVSNAEDRSFFLTEEDPSPKSENAEKTKEDVTDVASDGTKEN